MGYNLHDFAKGNSETFRFESMYLHIENRYVCFYCIFEESSLRGYQNTTQPYKNIEAIAF